jgi:hypothetical protein
MNYIPVMRKVNRVMKLKLRATIDAKGCTKCTQKMCTTSEDLH